MRLKDKTAVVTGAANGIGRAIQFDPAIAGGGFHPELLFERLKVASVVVEELLGEAGGFEMECFGRHGQN